MAYIGHFDTIPTCKVSAAPRTKSQNFARFSYYAILGALALIPIALPLIVKHFGLSF